MRGRIMEFTVKERYGYESIEFTFMDRPAFVIKPKVKPNGKWVIKTEYAEAFPETEIELLSRGWHVVYNKNDNRWAEPDDIDRKREFVKFVSREFGLDEKFVTVGMSCGGLYSVKLAATCPELVRGLYLDAPVINLLSCPFALGDSQTPLYEEYVRCTGRALSEMLSYRDHPLDKFDILLENNIPILLVSGDSDRTVPYHENGALLEKYYKENGGNITVIIKEGCDHHPHGYHDPKYLADCIERF